MLPASHTAQHSSATVLQEDDFEVGGLVFEWNGTGKWSGGAISRVERDVGDRVTNKTLPLPLFSAPFDD